MSEFAFTFVRGLVIGFMVAAPVGPIGVLVIRRSIGSGFRLGLATGLGAATADATYAAIGVLFTSSIAHVLAAAEGTLRVGGGFALIGLAVHGLVRKKKRAHGSDDTTPMELAPARAYASTIPLTMLSPMTALSFAAIAATFDVDEHASLVRASAFFAGVAAGSTTWWIMLSASCARLGRHLGARSRRAIDFGSAVALASFGIAALWAAR